MSAGDLIAVTIIGIFISIMNFYFFRSIIISAMKEVIADMGENDAIPVIVISEPPPPQYPRR